MSILLYFVLRIAVILKSCVITFWYRTHLTLTLKMMLWKCCTQYVSKFGKLSSGHRTGKGQFSFQSQRKEMPRNAQTTAQLHSSHMLVKSCTKFSKPGLQQYVNRELPDVQARFRKGRGIRDQIVNNHWIIEKARELQKNIYFWFIDYAKAFDYVDHSKLENSKRDGNSRSPDLPLWKPVCRSESNS